MDPTNPEIIYAAVWNSGIFRTTDGGLTWADFNDGLPTGTGADWMKLAASEPAGDGSVTLVAKMGQDSGLLFTCRAHVPPVVQARARRRLPFQPVWLDFNTPWQMLPGTHEPAGYNEWTDLVAIDPSRHNVIIAGGIGLQRSTDGGQTFSTVTGTHSDHHAVVFARSNNDLSYMACDGGVFRSVNDGASWTLRSSGLVATQLYSIGVSQTDPFLLGGATQDQGIIKTNGSADWTDTGAGNEGGFFIVDPLNGHNVYVTPWDGNLRRSTDGGATWQTILTGITQTGTPRHAVTVHHLAVCPTDLSLLLCVGGNEVFRSTDQGNTWTSVLTVPSGSGATRIAWEGQNTCYAAYGAGLVFRSLQQGAANTWSEPYTDANKPPSGVITALEARFVTWDIVAPTSGAAQLSERRVQSTARAGGIIVFPFRMNSRLHHLFLGRPGLQIHGRRRALDECERQRRRGVAEHSDQRVGDRQPSERHSLRRHRHRRVPNPRRRRELAAVQRQPAAGRGERPRLARKEQHALCQHHGPWRLPACIELTVEPPQEDWKRSGEAPSDTTPLRQSRRSGAFSPRFDPCRAI